MDPESPKPVLDPKYYLYQRQQHKKLRIAHDSSLIITDKRERKPIDKLLPNTLASEHDMALNRNPFHGKGFQPTTNRINTRLSPEEMENHELADQMTSKEWPHNPLKKLIKEDKLDDRAIHRAIMPTQAINQGFQISGYSINPFITPFTGSLPELNSILREIAKAHIANKKDVLMLGSLNIPSKPPEINQEPVHKNNYEAPTQENKAREFENRPAQEFGQGFENSDLNNKQNLEKNSELLMSPQPQEQPVKRKRGRPKGSKLQRAPNQKFSPAISNVAKTIDLKRVPRELKRIMTPSDLRLLSAKDQRPEHTDYYNDGFVENSLDQGPEDFAGQTGSELGPSQNRGSSLKASSMLRTDEQVLKNSQLQHFNRILPQELHGNFLKLLEKKDDISMVDENTNHTRLSSNFQRRKADDDIDNHLPDSILQKEKQLRENLKARASSYMQPVSSGVGVPKKRGPKKQQEHQQIEAQKSAPSNDKSLEVESSMQSDDEDVPIKATKNNKTFINCDIRYFNLDFLVEKLGHFDVILVDPPWGSPQSQPKQGSTVTVDSNNSLEYNTLSNQEIMNIRIDKLSHKGFIFLWILTDQLNISYEMLKRWGYEVVDQIIWVKMKDSSVFLSQGDHFMHSFEMCLVGYKCPPGEHVEYHSKISNNIIFAELKNKSQKPEELYDIIEFLMPGSKKIQLFARNHNLRPGWFALGDQLGDLHDTWVNKLDCNECQQAIKLGVKRYKAKKQANYDICEKCFKDKEAQPADFFEMKNNIQEDVLHQYHSCIKCNSEPIWGTRFTCKECENYDLCEACYDLNLQADDKEKFHDISHEFVTFEVPMQTDGLPTHPDNKCYACLQKPIVGPYFSCLSCTDLDFCQNCYFTKPIEYMRTIKGHLPYHQFEIITDPHFNYADGYKCQWCETSRIEGSVYKCDHCFEMYFCEKCYLKRESFKPSLVTSHKIYHSFTRINTN